MYELNLHNIFPTNLSGKAGFTANTHYHVIHYE